jgi:hypothetical protein
LDYQFDKITWDQERICLIGEKKGIVTELKFDSIEHKVQPEANRYSHLCAKIAYVIKRVLKIIVINGPVKAFEGTKEDINDLLSSKRTVGILFVAGVVGVGILAVGLLICSLANILFAILGSLIVAVGGILATCSAVLLRPPLFGLITSIGETLGSLDELYCEQVFS